MWKRGEKLHTHDGAVTVIGKDNEAPPVIPESLGKIRGFIRGAIIDHDPETGAVIGERVGDWHENIITQYGFNQVVRNFAGLAYTASSASAGNITDMGFGRYWGIGNHTEAASSNFSTMSKFDSLEYGTHSTNNSTGSRAAISASGTQLLAGTWTLSQSMSYASTNISNAVTINAIGQFMNVSITAASNATPPGYALSIATFASSTKGTNQALNITYNFVFST